MRRKHIADSFSSRNRAEALLTGVNITVPVKVHVVFIAMHFKPLAHSNILRIV
jgi:hypothetical protein